LSAGKNLSQQIKNVGKELQDMPVRSFSSSNWNETWTPEQPYNLRLIMTQYIGMTGEFGNVFSKSIRYANKKPET
jgi:hypothetical protein